MSPKKRKKMVSKRVDISLSRQCKILRISRSSLYYTPMGFKAETLELMRQIDKVHTKYSFFGSRQIAAYLLYPSGVRISRYARNLNLSR